ncbi:uncharacterized protein LOC124196487 [Daphnia pulex]|uniref:uncharacterized protein LOC124196487 n=1 Tax=Daphnia pulex TaxID=6669 RepID=UPI001EDE6F8C|nr:uncharacterized protein LOC124196487 [Daphnia pulex]
MKSVVILCLVFVAAASAGVSRSDVRFNMGGSQVAYSIDHRPDSTGGHSSFVSVKREEPVPQHFVHHLPVTVPAPAVHPTVAYPFVYPGTDFYAPFTTSFRQPKHYPAAYYPYTYSPYYPFAAGGHPGLIFVA